MNPRSPSCIILVIVLTALLSSCHVGRFVVYNFAGINDHKKFPKGNISKPEQPFHFYEVNTDQVKLPKSGTIKGKTLSFEELLQGSKTVAFLVVRNDSLYYEKYFNKYDKESVVASFSMAKSYVSALMGIAIAEGFIKSVNEPIVNYIPELNKEKFGNVTIEQVLNMRSGIYFNESYFNPFGDVAKYYYGTNLRKYIKKLKVKKAPGEEFEYISLNTQLLGLAIENATKKPLYKYLEEKIWIPLGMEYDASWSLDSRKNGTAKAFCCLNARARDFAKFGRLYLNNGNWNGRQIVPAEWVRRSTAGNNTGYSYQWWLLPTETRTDYEAQGILGQYTYVCPEKNMVIVRLGKKEGNINWEQLFQMIADKN